MPQAAIGLPDPTAYGSLETLRPGQLVPWVIQRHLAERAGPHYDVRFGKDRMHSFATKKELPVPGEKRMLFQQPLHEEAYKDFEGEIPAGYGKGTVKKQVSGEILVTSVGKDKVVFSTASERLPQRFALVRSKADPKQWILANITPTNTIQQKKMHYIKLPDDQVKQVLTDEFFISPKIDGAAAFYRLAGKKMDALSYRTSVTGRPIVHTERLGLQGARPEEEKETLLRGEIYGTRKGKAIPPQELGGLLNATISKSIGQQLSKDVQLKNMLFGVRTFRGKPVPAETPWLEQEKMLKEVLPQLPADKFHIAPMLSGETPEAAELFKNIRSGKYPLTEEGVVALPKKGGRPIKVKFRPEADVRIRSIFPGAGRLAGKGAGGFYYSLPEGEEEVGKVGTGFSDATRRALLEDPESFIGRLARISTQKQFPGGAYRAPSFLALHEDYPQEPAE